MAGLENDRKTLEKQAAAMASAPVAQPDLGAFKGTGFDMADPRFRTSENIEDRRPQAVTEDIQSIISGKANEMADAQQKDSVMYPRGEQMQSFRSNTPPKKDNFVKDMLIADNYDKMIDSMTYEERQAYFKRRRDNDLIVSADMYKAPITQRRQ